MNRLLYIFLLLAAPHIIGCGMSEPVSTDPSGDFPEALEPVSPWDRLPGRTGDYSQPGPMAGDEEPGADPSVGSPVEADEEEMEIPSIEDMWEHMPPEIRDHLPPPGQSGGNRAITWGALKDRWS